MISSTNKQRQPTPEHLDFLQEAIAASAALAAADSLGVLARLATGPADPVTLAHDCTISERAARLLMAALTSLGLIEEASGGSYRSIASDQVVGGMLRHWGHLAEAIREDRPTMAGDTPDGAGDLLVSHLGALFASAAEHVADHLVAQGLRDRVLDLGAGAAPWSLALAARNPGIRVTAVDLPAVLAVTREVVATSGYDLQFDYLSGDLFTVDLGHSAYDLAIAGNLCHLFDEATNRRLLGRLFDALRPGGTLAILDALPNERLDGPRSVILYALGLLLRTSRGQVYPFSTYVGWLRDIGYEAIELIDLSQTPPISLITAQRP
jgi:SAM-dependent methyltransferase